MNIFLPYPDNIDKSIRSLDDRRLMKQILECQTIVDVYNGGKPYSNHPIVKHYSDSIRQIKFVRYYGFKCCKEFEFRFGKKHAYSEKFPRIAYFLGTPQFVPLYLEGSKPNQLIETDPRWVGDMFQEKLIQKWLNDKYTPIWTNRPIPKFFEECGNNPVFLQNINLDQMIQFTKIIKHKENESK